MFQVIIRRASRGSGLRARVLVGSHDFFELLKMNGEVYIELDSVIAQGLAAELNE